MVTLSTSYTSCGLKPDHVELLFQRVVRDVGLETRVKISGGFNPEVETGVPSHCSGLCARGGGFDDRRRRPNRPALRCLLATTEQRNNKKTTRISVPVNKQDLWASESPGQLRNRRAVMLIPGGN
jgi:hypothetical protein